LRCSVWARSRASCAIWSKASNELSAFDFPSTALKLGIATAMITTAIMIARLISSKVNPDWEWAVRRDMQR
jgi:hypothetical protein